MKQQVTGSQAFFLSIVPGLGHMVQGEFASGLLWFIYMSLFYVACYLGVHSLPPDVRALIIPFIFLLHVSCAIHAVSLTENPEKPIK